MAEKTNSDNLESHSLDMLNPHKVSKTQIGLNNVDNTSDINKPVSTAQQEAIDDAFTQSNYYTDTKIAELINGAPESLDTLKEISDALAENETVMDALNAAIGAKSDQAELDGHIKNDAIHVIKSDKDNWNSAVEHITNGTNPHGTTKNDVGLGNVPDVTTNDQTPTFTESETLSKLVSGEKLSIVFSKISKAISDLISHIANKDNPHKVTKSQIGLDNVENKSSDTIRGELTKGNIIDALGYDPQDNVSNALSISIDIPLILPFTGWTSTEAPYSQTVTVPQIREGMTPLYFFNGTGDDAIYAFSLITGYDTGYAQITFYAADKPMVDIPLVLKGIPAQQLEYADNSVVVVVPADGFVLDENYNRYVQTIPVEGIVSEAQGSWDIVRSGEVLSVEESKIADSITDVIPMDGSIKIICLEPPEQQYMLKLIGTYTQTTEGTTLLAGMQGWFDKVNQLEDNLNNIPKLKYVTATTNNVTISIDGYISLNASLPGTRGYLFATIVNASTGNKHGFSIAGANRNFMLFGTPGDVIKNLSARYWYIE